MSRYGWIIYESYIEDGSADEPQAVEVFGPSDISDEDKAVLRAGEGREFELYDDSQTLYYKGRIAGYLINYTEPLDEYGRPNAGATCMRVRLRDFDRGGEVWEWVA